ncbi:hypothetical protein ABIB57_001038 [Devosia sp. UYZn731]
MRAARSIKAAQSTVSHGRKTMPKPERAIDYTNKKAGPKGPAELSLFDNTLVLGTLRKRQPTLLP